MESSASAEDVHFYSGLICFTLMFLCAPILKYAVENYGYVFRHGIKGIQAKMGSSKTKGRIGSKKKRKYS
jgi:hypothetical protein